MVTCAECGKQLKTFQIGAISDWKGNRFCSLEHKEKFTKGLKDMKDKDKEMKSKGMIKEIKCKCNQCGKTWHFLKSEEKELMGRARANAFAGLGMCCNPFGHLFINKSGDLKREAEKLAKCPKCGSGDIKKESIYYEKKA